MVSGARDRDRKAYRALSCSNHVALVRTIEKRLMTFLNKLRINDFEDAHEPKLAKRVKQRLEFKSAKTSAFTP